MCYDKNRESDFTTWIEALILIKYFSRGPMLQIKHSKQKIKNLILSLLLFLPFNYFLATNIAYTLAVSSADFAAKYNSINNIYAILFQSL